MIVLIDGNNVGIQSHFANENLVGPDGMPTGAVFGTVRTLMAVADKVRARYPGRHLSFMCAWDDKPSWRSDHLPTYKVRPRDEEHEQRMAKFACQMPALRQTLAHMGVKQVCATRFEADDIAGFLTRKMDKHSFVLVTGDEDWLQLIDGGRVVVYQPAEAKARFVDSTNFKDVTGGFETAEQFVAGKAIMGDVGDCVPGCPGIGPAFAARFLRGELKKGKKYEAIAAWLASGGWRRAHTLVELRTIEIPPAALQVTPGVLNEDELFNDFTRMGFSSIVGAWLMWVARWKGEAAAAAA